MITIAEAVHKLVARKPFITEALKEGLINVSSLARQLQPEIEQQLGKPVKSGAIVMAINRMDMGDLLWIDKNLKSFFKKLSDISVRSNLTDYTFINSPTLLDNQRRLLSLISQQTKRVFYTFSQGISETTIIIANSIQAEMESIFRQEHLLGKQEELSSITLMLPEENRVLYGVYYHILKQLAWNGINLIEVISTSNEFTIIVNDKDIDQAFSILTQLRKGW